MIYTYLQVCPGAEPDNIANKHRIGFIGEGVEDGEDNFFTITVSEGEGDFERESSTGMTGDGELPTVASSPFIFRDGTPGIWKYQVWDASLFHGMGDIRATYYEGIVQDDDGKCNIHLFMLKEEYDANKTDIISFLKSACFREADAGVYENKGLLDREVLTMHIRDEYLNMSFQIPEGAALIKKGLLQ